MHCLLCIPNITNHAWVLLKIYKLYILLCLVKNVIIILMTFKMVNIYFLFKYAYEEDFFPKVSDDQEILYFLMLSNIPVSGVVSKEDNILEKLLYYVFEMG